MKNRLKRLAAAGLALLSAASMSAVSFADYSTFEHVTSHVELAVPQTLSITKPAEDITVTSSHYYIMGSSDPDYPLYLSGHEITGRGRYGSFGVYVELAYGRNRVTFTNGGDTATVYITRSDDAAAPVATTVSSMFPSSNTADFYGEKVELSCVAPSGATVTATVKSRTVQLKQAAATAQPGVAATFKGEYAMPDADGAVSLGPVTYTMTYNGETVSRQSVGELITVGEGNDLVVECNQVSAGVMKTPGGQYIATAKLGATERVVDAEGSYYQLSMGGWISKANVDVLLGKPQYSNVISSISFTQEPDAEVYGFIGTNDAFVQSWQDGGTLYLNLFNTSGLGSFTTEHSSLFASSEVRQNTGGSTTVKLTLKPEAELWGHTIQYDDGVIELICQYRPKLSGSAGQPLEGIVVALDSGHGSSDPGALGIAQLTGPTEAQINRATALAVKKQLEAMGATVHLPDPLDLNSRFNERMQPAIDSRADLFISLHCNSTAENANGINARGTEVYYYEPIGKKLGDSLINTLIPQTGRANRGVKFYEFRVTLNSLAPSVLVEMGFMTNPVEYDDLCSKQGIYSTAVAVGDAVVDLLA